MTVYVAIVEEERSWTKPELFLITCHQDFIEVLERELGFSLISFIKGEVDTQGTTHVDVYEKFFDAMNNQDLWHVAEETKLEEGTQVYNLIRQLEKDLVGIRSDDYPSLYLCNFCDIITSSKEMCGCEDPQEI